MREDLSVLIQAQYPLVYLVTFEEERAEQMVATVAQQLAPQRRLFTWTMTHGIVEYGQPRNVTQHNSTVSPEAAIEWVMRQREPGIYVFKDLHPFRDSPAVTRCLRDAITSFRESEKTIVLMSPIQEVPIELEKEVVVLDFPMPDMGELNQMLSQHLGQSGSARVSTEVREKLLTAALGLTRDEADKVYRKAKVVTGQLTEAEVDIVLSEKKQLIRRNGILEFMEVDDTLNSVGGLEELKHWLKQRSNAFTERAREYGLPQPKGMLILGVPGCGKSLIAKTTSRLWGLPLLRLIWGGSMMALPWGDPKPIYATPCEPPSPFLRPSSSLMKLIRLLQGGRAPLTPMAAPLAGFLGPSSPGCKRRLHRCLSWPRRIESNAFPVNFCARVGLTKSSLLICPTKKSAKKSSISISRSGVPISRDLISIN